MFGDHFPAPTLILRLSRCLQVVVLGAGSFVGEIAMLSELERTATVVTKTYCHVLELSRSAFEEVGKEVPSCIACIKKVAECRVQELEKRQEHERRSLLGKVPILAESVKDENFVQMMASHLTSKAFDPESFICHRGLFSSLSVLAAPLMFSLTLSFMHANTHKSLLCTPSRGGTVNPAESTHRRTHGCGSLLVSSDPPSGDGGSLSDALECSTGWGGHVLQPEAAPYLFRRRGLACLAVSLEDAQPPRGPDPEGACALRLQSILVPNSNRVASGAFSTCASSTSNVSTVAASMAPLWGRKPYASRWTHCSCH